MTELKHTPGPWKEQPSGISRDIGMTDCRIVGPARGRQVCHVYIDCDQDICNARLISAAPDLLSEHEGWSELLGEVKLALLQGDSEKALHMLEAVEIVFGPRNDGGPSTKSAAIAKAKGESHD